MSFFFKKRWKSGNCFFFYPRRQLRTLATTRGIRWNWKTKGRRKESRAISCESVSKANVAGGGVFSLLDKAEKDGVRTACLLGRWQSREWRKLSVKSVRNFQTALLALIKCNIRKKKKEQQHSLDRSIGRSTGWWSGFVKRCKCVHCHRFLHLVSKCLKL